MEQSCDAGGRLITTTGRNWLDNAMLGDLVRGILPS